MLGMGWVVWRRSAEVPVGNDGDCMSMSASSVPLDCGSCRLGRSLGMVLCQLPVVCCTVGEVLGERVDIFLRKHGAIARPSAMVNQIW